MMVYNWRETAKQLEDTSRSIQSETARAAATHGKSASTSDQSDEQGSGGKQKSKPKEPEAKKDTAIPLASEGASLSPIGSNGSARAMPSSGGGGGGHYNLTSPQKAEMASAIRSTADRLGVDPNHLATAMSFETGGTLNPWQAGPTTKYGQHMGLIQWGEPQRQQYGIHSGMSITDQVNAAGKYLQDRGVKPGMGLENIYAAILRGHATHVDHVTDKNGTSVISAAENMRRTGHAHALERLEGGVTTPSSARGATTPSTLPRKNTEAGATGPRAEAIPTNQMAANTGTMNDASPSRAQEMGGRTKVASATTPAASTPSTSASPTTRVMTDAEVTAAVAKGEHINYNEKDQPVTTSPGQAVTSGNRESMVEKGIPTPDSPTAPAGGTPSKYGAGGNWQEGMPKPGDPNWHGPMAAPGNAPPAQPDATTKPADPNANPLTSQGNQTGVLDDIGSFFGELFNISDNLKTPNGEWDPLYGFEKQPAGAAQAAPTQTASTQAAPDAGGGLFSGLFDGDVSVNNNAGAQPEPQPAPQPAPQPEQQGPDVTQSADAGDFAGGNNSLSGVLGSIFGGFERGGPVQSFANGGLVAKHGTPGRADRIASAQPGVAIPTADRGTAPGGGYGSNRAVSPGYARGGLVKSFEGGGPFNRGPGGTEVDPNAPAVDAITTPTQDAPATPATPQTPPPVDYPTVAAPKTDTGWNVGYTAPQNPETTAIPGGEDWKEQQHQRHREEAMQDHERSLMMNNSFTFGGLLRNALHGVVTGVSDKYDIGGAATRAQGQGVPTDGQDPFSDITAFFTGDHSSEAVTSDQMGKITKAVDPNGKLKDGIDKTAGLVATYKHYLEQGDIEGANHAATAIVWHLQGLSGQYGAQAYAYLKGGNTEAGVQALIKGYNNIPDGMSVRVAKQGDGVYHIEQYDIKTGKATQTFTAGPQDLLAASMGLKNGTAFWESLTHAASNKRDGGTTQAYRDFETASVNAQSGRPDAPAPAPAPGRPPAPNPDDNEDAPPPSPTAAITSPVQSAGAIPTPEDPIKVAEALAPKENGQSSGDFLVQRQKALEAKRMAGRDGGPQVAADTTRATDANNDVRGALPVPPGSDPRRLQSPAPNSDEANINILKGSNGFQSSADARRATEANMAANDTKYNQAVESGQVREAIPWNQPQQVKMPSNDDVYNRFLNDSYKRMPKPPQQIPLYKQPDTSGMTSQEARVAIGSWQKQNELIKAQNAASAKSYTDAKKSLEAEATSRYKNYLSDQKRYDEGLEKTNKPLDMVGGSVNMGNYNGETASISDLVSQKFTNAGVTDKDMQSLPSEVKGTASQVATWAMQHNPGVSPERAVDAVIKAVMPVVARPGEQNLQNMSPARVVALGDRLNRYKIIPNDPGATPIILPAEALPMIGTLRSQMFRQSTMSKMDTLHTAEQSNRNWAPVKKFFGVQ